MATPVIDKTKRKARWYFGGIASCGAACFTHPLDLIKVHLQTQSTGQKLTIVGQGIRIIKNDGLFSLYNGLSASCLRQLTYSMTRFGVYEVMKQRLTENGKPMPFVTSVAVAASAGAVGGLIGTPADQVNVRMQNDMKLSPELRRNYKHAVDGLVRIIQEEGVVRLMNGWSTAFSRAILMTVGQLCFYDIFKQQLLKMKFEDNVGTHFGASFLAGGVATSLTQPLDVLKTRMMNAKPGVYRNLMDLTLQTAKEGPMAFFKGFIPAFIRLGPHTILTFILLEQLRINFGQDLSM